MSNLIPSDKKVLYIRSVQSIRCNTSNQSSL